MKRLFILGLLASFLAWNISARADDDSLKEVEKHIKTLKTSKLKSERLSAVSDLLLLSTVANNSVGAAVGVLTDVFKNEKDEQIRATAARVLHNSGAEAKEVIPICIAILEGDKLDGDLKTATAQLVLACWQSKEAQQALPILKKIERAEIAKDEPNRNDHLLEAVRGAIDALMKGNK
jgi:hypothetical protein